MGMKTINMNTDEWDQANIGIEKRTNSVTFICTEPEIAVSEWKEGQNYERNPEKMTSIWIMKSLSRKWKRTQSFRTAAAAAAAAAA